MHLTKEQWAEQTYHDPIPRSVKLQRLLWLIAWGLSARETFIFAAPAQFTKNRESRNV